MSDPSESTRDLRRRMQAGAMWMVTFKLIDRTLGLLSTLVLARMLVPADFGIVAMATSVITLLEIFATFGLEAALIRERQLNRGLLDTAWTLNVLIGIGVAIGVALLSPVAAHYYGQPVLVQALCVLALSPMIQGLENIGVVAFRRELRFNAEFGYMLGKRLVTLSTVIPMAFLLRSWWALVIGTVVGRIGAVALSYVVQSYRPRFSLSHYRDFIQFSKWIMLVNGLAFFLQRSADLIVGRVAGARSLGLYSVSLELGNLPTTELIAPINRAVYPAYARLAHDQALLRAEYLGVIGAIALLGIPAAVGVTATAKYAVPVLLGAKWHDAIHLMEIFGLFGLTQVLQTNIWSVYLAIGKPRLQFIVHALQLVLLIPGLFILTQRYGVHGAAFATVVAGLCVLPINLLIVFRELRCRVLDFIAQIWRPLVAAIAMYVGVFELFPARAADVPLVALYELLGAVVTGATVYLAALFILWRLAGAPPGAERWLIAKSTALFQRLVSWRGETAERP